MTRLLGLLTLSLLLFFYSSHSYAQSASHQKCLDAIANFESSKNTELVEEISKLKKKMKKKALKIARDANKEEKDIKLNDDFIITKFTFEKSSVYQSGGNFELYFQMEGTTRHGVPILINLYGGYDLGIVRGKIDREAGVETGKTLCQYSHIMPYYVISNLDNGHVISSQRHRRISHLYDIINSTFSNDLRREGIYFSALID